MIVNRLITVEERGTSRQAEASASAGTTRHRIDRFATFVGAAPVTKARLPGGLLFMDLHGISRRIFLKSRAAAG